MSLEHRVDFHFERADTVYGQDRFREALSHLDATLEIQPDHTESLMLAGDIYSLHADDMGMDESTADRIAIDYFDRALAREWKLAEAWAGKALALAYLERHEEALDAAERGLFVLPLCFGVAMTYDPVHVNVAESLFREKVLALVNTGKKDEARQALTEAFQYGGKSDYLADLVEDVAPLDLPRSRNGRP